MADKLDHDQRQILQTNKEWERTPVGVSFGKREI